MESKREEKEKYARKVGEKGRKEKCKTGKRKKIKCGWNSFVYLNYVRGNQSSRR